MISDELSIKDLLAEFEEDSNNLGAITKEVASSQVEAQTFSIPKGATLIEPGDSQSSEQNYHSEFNPNTAKWALIGITSNEMGKRIAINDSITLGRSSKADVTIDDNLISRRHVTISLKPEGLFVEDLNSSNGTFVNNTSVTSTALNIGDTLTIGDSSFMVQGPQEEIRTVVRNEPMLPTPDATMPAQPLRFCTQCGTKLKANTRFCVECGKKY